MAEKEHIEALRQAEAALREAAASLASAVPRLEQELDLASETSGRLERAERQLAVAIRELNDMSSALSKIEDAILGAAKAAQDSLHDSKIPLDARLGMAKVCRGVFGELVAAGFVVTIPELGDDLDAERHLVKGQARSALGAAQIADVVSWGHRFPSGRSQLAEVLVGDGSLAEKREPEPTPPQPKSKAGIKMVLEDGPTAAAPRKKSASKRAGTGFDQLAQAAERNREKE